MQKLVHLIWWVMGIFQFSQCNQVPPGASGSSTIRTRDAAASGILARSSGGLSFDPSQVYFTGILSFSLKAGLVTMIILKSSTFVASNDFAGFIMH